MLNNSVQSHLLSKILIPVLKFATPTEATQVIVFTNWPLAFACWNYKNGQKTIVSVMGSLVRSVICGKSIGNIQGCHSLFYREFCCVAYVWVVTELLDIYITTVLLEQDLARLFVLKILVSCYCGGKCQCTATKGLLPTTVTWEQQEK